MTLVNKSGGQDDPRVIAEFDEVITHLVAEYDLSLIIPDLIRDPERLIGEICPCEDI